MTHNREFHYCKHCNNHFKIEVDPELTGDYFLVCPTCKWQHYRYFYNGTAIHCDITRRKKDPVVLRICDSR